MQQDSSTKTSIKVADEVWVATALLHYEDPRRQDFTIQEITKRAEREAIHGTLRPSFYVHVDQHCVANRPPNPARYLMLYETSRGRRRLYRPSDPHHPDRKGAKIVPERDGIPPEYRYLLDWYAKEYVSQAEGSALAPDPILSLRGLGKEVWASEDPDEYVRRMREGWE